MVKPDHQVPSQGNFPSRTAGPKLMLVSPDLPFLVKPRLVISLFLLASGSLPLHSSQLGAAPSGAVPGSLWGVPSNITMALSSPLPPCDASTLCLGLFHLGINGTTELQHLFLASLVAVVIHIITETLELVNKMVYATI